MRSIRARVVVGFLLSVLSSASFAQAGRLSLSFQTCDEAESMRASRSIHSDAASQGIAIFNFSIHQANQKNAPARSEIGPGLNDQIVEKTGGFSCSGTSSKAQLMWNGCVLPSSQQHEAERK